MAKKIILASASPRRKMLLKKAGLKFEVVKSDYEENNNENISPENLVLKHALGKARDVAEKMKGAVVIGADTIVVIDDEVIGKAKDDEDAKRMLKKLSARTHKVITCFVIIDTKAKKEKARTVTTKVTFKHLSDEAIEEYVSRGEYVGKAGAYAYQGAAVRFMEKVEGSKSNVLGLPMEEFMGELEYFIE